MLLDLEQGENFRLGYREWTSEKVKFLYDFDRICQCCTISAKWGFQKQSSTVKYLSLQVLQT